MVICLDALRSPHTWSVQHGLEAWCLERAAGRPGPPQCCPGPQPPGRTLDQGLLWETWTETRGTRREDIEVLTWSVGRGQWAHLISPQRTPNSINPTPSTPKHCRQPCWRRPGTWERRKPTATNLMKSRAKQRGGNRGWTEMETSSKTLFNIL